jgi:hypothetical protein
VIAFSCMDQKANNPASYNNKESSMSPKPINDSNFIVKDSSMYARSFLDSLKYSGYGKTYKITDGTLILDQRDTAFIPLDLTIGKTTEFVGSKNDRHYYLLLTQLNYTTIRFGVAVYENKELIDKQVGDADLRPLFFLGAESDDDEVSGISYLSTEYASSKNKDCGFAIRLGKNEANELLVKIKRRCNDSIKSIRLDQSPTFRRTKNAS